MTRFERLKSKGVQLDVFQYEGRFFIGKLETAIQNFIKNNPDPADFYVWLQDHYTEISVK